MKMYNKNISGFTLALVAAGLVGAAGQVYAQSGQNGAMKSGQDQVAQVKCFGVNSCKGHNDCATARNACKGQGSCKGQGFLMKTTAECAQLGGKVEQS